MTVTRDALKMAQLELEKARRLKVEQRLAGSRGAIARLQAMLLQKKAAEADDRATRIDCHPS